jgi:hypothetical protein
MAENVPENVLKFPSSRIVRENVNVEAIEQAKEKSVQKFADSITDGVIMEVLQTLENCGIDLDKTSFQKDFSLVANALRATTYRNFEIDHPFHVIIDGNDQLSAALDNKE